MRRYKKTIAPRLASGQRRDSIAHGLPPHIKRGLAMRAYNERQSVSWLLEQIIVYAFKFDAPEYVEPKPKRPAQDQRKNDKEKHARAS